MKRRSGLTRDALLTRILDIAADAIIAVGADQRILLFNQAAERTFGFQAGEVLGRTLDVVLPRFAATDGVPIPMAPSLPVTARRKDGSEFPAEVDISRVTEGGQTVLVAILRDVTERQCADEALRHSEERHRSIVAAMEAGIVMQDAEGRIITSNASAERILGLTQDQLMGRTSMDPRWQATLEDGSSTPGENHPITITLRTGEPQSGVVMSVQRSDGSRVWLRVNTQPLCRPGETRPYSVVASFTDITRSRQAEQELRESEARYRALFENSMDGVLLTGPEGDIYAANPEACRLLGRTEEEICRAGRAGIVDATDPRVRAALEERRRTGSFRSEMTLNRKDGTRFPAEVSSRVFTDRDGKLRTSMIVRDITERQGAEKALQDQELLLRDVVEIMPVGVWMLDREGRIVSGNEAARRIWGGSRYVGIDRFGEYKGWWHETGKPIEPTEWGAARAIRKGETSLGEVIEIEDFDGVHKIILHSAIPTRDSAGQINGAIVVNQDITDRIQAYQSLERRVAERTRELAAVLEVSRNVASTLELKPLLNLILNQLRTVLDFTGAGIAIRDGENLKLAGYEGPAPREQMLNLVIPLDRDSAYLRVVQTRKPVIIDDFWADTPWLNGIRAAWDEETLRLVRGARAWLGVPLIAKGELIGVLRVEHAEPGHYTEDHARLATAFAEQTAVAIENARLYESAQQVAALEERQHLARELHDSVSQSLYGIVLGARTARTLLEREPAQAWKPLDYVLALAEAAFADMRALIFELRPDSLAVEGLVAALARQIDVIRARHAVVVDADLPAEPDLPLDAKEALYRIAQEALNNAVKHAHANRVRLRLASEADSVLLEISDDGQGFDVGRVPTGHLGLVSMRERAERAKGTLHIESVSGAGTRITVRVHSPAATSRS